MKNAVRYPLRGHIADVTDYVVGDVLASSHSSGVSALDLEDASQFDERGGQLIIDDTEVLDYTTVDYDANRVFLDGTTSAAYEDGVSVSVWPEIVERRATVVLEDADLDDDIVDARVMHSLFLLIPTGIRKEPT